MVLLAPMSEELGDGILRVERHGVSAIGASTDGDLLMIQRAKESSETNASGQRCDENAVTSGDAR
jgi:hypothetical protein